MVYPTKLYGRRRIFVTPTSRGVEQAKDLEETGCDLYCRVSSRSQDAVRQVLGAKVVLKEMGKTIVNVYHEIASGKDLNRKEFNKAVRHARKRGIPLIAPCFSRFLRNERFDATKKPDRRPTKREIIAFLEKTKGTIIATIHHPDASPNSDKKFLEALSDKAGKRTIRGMKRPGYAKRRKNEWKGFAKKKHVKGMSFRAIAELVSKLSGFPVSYSTIRRWILK